MDGERMQKEEGIERGRSNNGDSEMRRDTFIN